MRHRESHRTDNWQHHGQSILNRTRKLFLLHLIGLMSFWATISNCWLGILRFCLTWTKRYPITSQTSVECVSRTHHRTIHPGFWYWFCNVMCCIFSFNPLPANFRKKKNHMSQNASKLEIHLYLGAVANGVYSLKWRLTERYPKWGTLADPRLGRAAADQCKSSEFLQELRISGFPRFGVSPTCFRAK